MTAGRSLQEAALAELMETGFRVDLVARGLVYTSHTSKYTLS